MRYNKPKQRYGLYFWALLVGNAIPFALPILTFVIYPSPVGFSGGFRIFFILMALLLLLLGFASIFNPMPFWKIRAFLSLWERKSIPSDMDIIFVRIRGVFGMVAACFLLLYVFFW